MCKQDTSFVFVKEDHSLRQLDRASIYFLNIQLPCAAHFVVFLFRKHKTPHSVTLPLTSHGIKAEYFVQLWCWPLFERQKRWNINTKAWLNRMHDAFSGTMMPFRKNGKLSFVRPQKCPCSFDTNHSWNHNQPKHWQWKCSAWMCLRENRVCFDTTKRILLSINCPWILEETSVSSRKCSEVAEHLRLLKQNA